MQIKDITPGPQGQRGIKTVRRDAAPTGIGDFQPDDVPPADTSDHPGGPAGPATTATPAAEVPAEPATVDQIREWLSIFVEPYQVVEIRIPQPFRGRVQSRLFRGPEEAARYAARWSGKAKAVYFTLNPLSPDKTEGSACARDVLERRWLFVDFDPIRAEGFGTDSATDVERRRARVVAVQARAWLRSLGFPDPVICDSGNGFHLLYQIWLPNDDASKALIEGVLKALAARFDTDDVKVDTGLFDANRIDKVYGTKACKGPGTTERPHRSSRVLKVPDAIEPVATALLEELAAESKALDLEAEITREPAAHAAGDGAGGPPVPAGANGRAGTNKPAWVGTTVADDYRARGPDWGEILEPHNWKLTATLPDGERRWTRPGKDGADGISATTGHAGQDCFHVFSDQAKPFAPNESYSKFQAYALLKHGGDESKAAAELYKAGYGTRQPPPPPTDDDRPEWHKDRAGFLDDAPPGPPMNGRHDPEANGRVATPEPEPGIVAALIEEAKTFRSELEVLSAEDFLSACARLDRKGLDRVAAVIKDRKLGPRAFRRAVAAGKPKWAGTAGADDHPYVEHGDETYMTFVTKEGEIAERRIADFTARIVREVERHEAGERRFQFEIEATHRTGVVARATVDAEQYAKMGWVESLGSLFKVMEGRGDRGHLKLAIQFLSWQEADVPRETVYTSMGWIEHEGEWLYLHAGGALGAFGPSDAVRVEVPGPFARYTLPDPGEGPEEIRAAIAACFGILALAKADRPGAAAVAAILATLPWRAPLGPSDFTIHFGGGSGNYKTSAAKIACQHFAPGVDRNSKPPFTWESTAASLQRSAFDGADTVLLIDELTGERALEIGTAFIQAQGNLKGKDRSTSNMGSATGLDPRGSPLSTGEVDLTRQSAQGRSLAVRFMQGMIDKAVLETLQDAADSGRYATAMAAYLRWLAGRIEDARRAHKKTVAGLAKTIRRETEGDAVHPRHPGIVAELGAAYSLFLEFAVEQGACDRATADAYAGTVRTYLMDLLREQGDIQRELGPGRRFLTLLRAGLGAKYYHLQAAHDDNAPTPYASECGWHKDWVYQGKDVGSVLEWKIPPNSKAIGFIDVPDGFIYLNRQMAMEVARAMGDRQGTPFENVAGLARDLADAKLIMTVKEGEKTRYEVQRRIRGTKDRFLALQLEQVFGPPEG